MGDGRNLLGWLLVAMVAAVGAGGAVLGVSQAPNNAPLAEAASNTLSARNYTQVLFQTTNQAHQTENLVFQSPDRLGGYVQSGDQRSYVYVIGNTQYRSVTALVGTPPSRLTFYSQPSQGAKAYDPAHYYLRYVKLVKHPGLSGSTYSFSYTSQGQTGYFTYTVSGNYISQFTLNVPSAHAYLRLDISGINTSPPVHLPPGARVIPLQQANLGS